MELKISKDELNQIPIHNNGIFRCSKCFKIQYVHMYQKNNDIVCELKCDNKHEFKESLKKLFEKIHENQIENIICSLCNNVYSKIPIYYCRKKNNFICENCIKIIDCEEKILVDDIDIYCNIHNKSNLYFCKTCSKEFCIECLLSHNSHSIFKLLPLNNKEIEEFQNKISIMENKLIELEKNTNSLIDLLGKFIKQLNFYKNNYLNIGTLELFYAKSLLNIYNSKKLKKKLCNPIFENIRNFKSLFQSFEFNKNEELKNTLNEILISFKYELPIKNNLNYSIDSTTCSISNYLYSFSNLDSSHEFENTNEIDVKYNKKYNKESRIITRSSKSKIKNLNFKNRINTFTISDTKNLITSLIFSNDNQLILGDEKGNITIYSNDNYTLLKSFRPHYKCINYLSKMCNGEIICCSSDTNISIFSIKNQNDIKLNLYIKGHKNSICEGIEFTNGFIYSSSLDKTIRIWEKSDTGKYIQKKKKVYENEINAFIELNNNEIVGTNFYKEQIIFLNSNTLEEKFKMGNIKCGSLTSSITLIDNDLIAVGGEGLYIINVIKKKILHHICTSKHYLKCLFFDYDSNEIIIGNEIGQILTYNLNNKNYELVNGKENNKNTNIYSINKNNKGIIAISSNDIKIWE